MNIAVDVRSLLLATPVPCAVPRRMQALLVQTVPWYPSMCFTQRSNDRLQPASQPNKSELTVYLWK